MKIATATFAWDKKYKGFTKFKKKKTTNFFLTHFSILLYCNNLFSPTRIIGCNSCGTDTSLDTQISHIDLFFIFDVTCYLTSNVIWCQMTHMTSIYLWHNLIWPILMSKEAYEPQQLHLILWSWLYNCFKV